MPEILTSRDAPKGYAVLGTHELEVLFYRMFSHFAASAELSKLGAKEEGFYCYNLQKEHEELEITSLIISTGSLLRILDDGLKRNLSKDATDWAGSVGTWQTYGSKPKLRDLPLREACNKIIHAARVNFWREFLPDPDESSFPPLLPKISLYGKDQWNVDWMVTIDVQRLFDYALAIIAYAKGQSPCRRRDTG